MTTHLKAQEIIEAIKALPLWSDPQTFRELEISMLYSDRELVQCFGWDGKKPRTVSEAVGAVNHHCRLRVGGNEAIHDVNAYIQELQASLPDPIWETNGFMETWIKKYKALSPEVLV